MFEWDSRTLYEAPAAGTCRVSGKYETGRYYRDENNKPVFVGNSAAPKVVRDYVGLQTALGAVNAFKRGYSKSEWTAKRV